MTKVNPFRPNSPVHPGMFAGRGSELQRLDAALQQTKAGSPVNFMITGERGIGKSSLLNFIKDVAGGRIKWEDVPGGFLVVDTDIDAMTTPLTLARKMEMALTHALGKDEKARQFLKQAWAFLSRLEAGGVKIKGTEETQEQELILEEFAYSLADIAQRVCSGGPPDVFSAQYDGILILIDEADNASEELSLGAFIKLLSERLQRRGCTKVAFGIAGLPNLRAVLTNSHPSSLRLFEELTLDRLKSEDVRRVITRGLTLANEKNVKQVEITNEAIERLVYLSEGYPHFIQQFSFSAYETDYDEKIDLVDVERGAFQGNQSAIKLIGDRYYRDAFFNKIQKDSYRQVLRIMADKLDGWISKKEISNQFRGNNSTLDNAIKALRDRKIILAKEGERGVYRLQYKGFAWWMKLHASQRSDEGASGFA